MKKYIWAVTSIFLHLPKVYVSFRKPTLQSLYLPALGPSHYTPVCVAVVDSPRPWEVVKAGLTITALQGSEKSAHLPGTQQESNGRDDRLSPSSRTLLCARGHPPTEWGSLTRVGEVEGSEGAWAPSVVSLRTGNQARRLSCSRPWSLLDISVIRPFHLSEFSCFPEIQELSSVLIGRPTLWLRIGCTPEIFHPFLLHTGQS